MQNCIWNAQGTIVCQKKIENLKNNPSFIQPYYSGIETFVSDSNNNKPIMPREVSNLNPMHNNMALKGF